MLGIPRQSRKNDVGRQNGFLDVIDKQMSSRASFAYAENTEFNYIMWFRRKLHEINVFIPMYYRLNKSRHVSRPFSKRNLRFSIYSNDRELLCPCRCSVYDQKTSAFIVIKVITVYTIITSELQWNSSSTSTSTPTGYNEDNNISVLTFIFVRKGEPKNHFESVNLSRHLNQ